MFWIELFHDPTETPGSDGDLNLISIYGFKVSLSESDSEGRPTLITVDATEAEEPPRYPFSVEDVAEATVKAVRIEFPDEELTKIEFKRVSDVPGNRTANKPRHSSPDRAAVEMTSLVREITP